MNLEKIWFGVWGDGVGWVGVHVKRYLEIGKSCKSDQQILPWDLVAGGFCSVKTKGWEQRRIQESLQTREPWDLVAGWRCVKKLCRTENQLEACFGTMHKHSVSGDT